jgi:hypothetical protein
MIFPIASPAVSMFADDTKCHCAVRNLQDKEILQSDLNNITNWCQDCRVDLDKFKCGVLQFTRCLQTTINQSSDTPHSGNQRDATSLNIQFLIIHAQAPSGASNPNLITSCFTLFWNP